MNCSGGGYHVVEVLGVLAGLAESADEVFACLVLADLAEEFFVELESVSLCGDEDVLLFEHLDILLDLFELEHELLVVCVETVSREFSEVVVVLEALVFVLESFEGGGGAFERSARVARLEQLFVGQAFLLSIADVFLFSFPFFELVFELLFEVDAHAAFAVFFSLVFFLAVLFCVLFDDGFVGGNEHERRGVFGGFEGLEFFFVLAGGGGDWFGFADDVELDEAVGFFGSLLELLIFFVDVQLAEQRVAGLHGFGVGVSRADLGALELDEVVEDVHGALHEGVAEVVEVVSLDLDEVAVLSAVEVLVPAEVEEHFFDAEDFSRAEDGSGACFGEADEFSFEDDDDRVGRRVLREHFLLRLDLDDLAHVHEEPLVFRLEALEELAEAWTAKEHVLQFVLRYLCHFVLQLRAQHAHSVVLQTDGFDRCLCAGLGQEEHLVSSGYQRRVALLHELDVVHLEDCQIAFFLAAQVEAVRRRAG